MAPGSRLTMSNAVALGACLRMKSVPMVLTDFAAFSTRISPPPGSVPTTRCLVTVSVSTLPVAGGRGGFAGVGCVVLSSATAMPGPRPSSVLSATVSTCRRPVDGAENTTGRQGGRGMGAFLKKIFLFHYSVSSGWDMTSS